MRAFTTWGLRPKPPAAASGGPCAPRRVRRGPPCGPLPLGGYAPNPRRPLAGAPAPRAASAEARRAGLYHLGAAPQTPGSPLAGTPAPRAASAEPRCARLGDGRVDARRPLRIQPLSGVAPQTPGSRQTVAALPSARPVSQPHAAGSIKYELDHVKNAAIQPGKVARAQPRPRSASAGPRRAIMPALRASDTLGVRGNSPACTEPCAARPARGGATGAPRRDSELQRIWKGGTTSTDAVAPPPAAHGAARQARRGAKGPPLAPAGGLGRSPM